MEKAVFLVIIGAYINVFFTIKVNILNLLNWSYRFLFPPPSFNNIHYLSLEGQRGLRMYFNLIHAYVLTHLITHHSNGGS